MLEIIIGAAILAGATAAFIAFWDAVCDWCLNKFQKYQKAFTTFVKKGYNVMSYYYHRLLDGWYREPIPEEVSVEECPLSVRRALFENEEIIVKRYN